MEDLSLKKVEVNTQKIKAYHNKEGDELIFYNQKKGRKNVSGVIKRIKPNVEAIKDKKIKSIKIFVGAVESKSQGLINMIMKRK